MSTQRRSKNLATNENDNRLQRESSSLLQALRQPHPLRAVSTVFGEPKIDVRSREQAARLESTAYTFASRLWHKIAPRYSIPVLMRTMNEYYYGAGKMEPSWAGTALKTSIALAYSSLLHGTSAGPASTMRITYALSTVAMYEQLSQLGWLYMALGDCPVALSSEGLLLSGDMRDLALEAGAAFSKRGLLHRTLHDSGNALWRRPIQAERGILSILKGGNPRDQEAFAGTIFHDLPAEPIEFWQGLYARLILLLDATAHEIQLNRDPNAVWLVSYQKPGVNADTPNKQTMKKSYGGIVWDPEWYATHSPSEMLNMVVHRPVVPIDRHSCTAVTSTRHIGDSLNWFVEASVMGYGTSDSIKLPDAVFDRLISKKFERTVLEAFAERGFLSGKVRDSGYWENGPRGVLLENSTGPIPGEIDLLAWNKSAGLVVVGECKVLAITGTPTALRNIVCKIGDVDSEQFHSKLRKKIEWARGTLLLNHLPEDSFVGMIILDRRFPGMGKGEHIVSDIDSINSTIDRSLSERRQAQT